jgi:hypothetical protein
MAATYTILTDVIWPSDLLLPPRPPKLVYLDMLGWINMAEAHAGNAVPHGYDRVLEAWRRAKSDGCALFPLSSTHVLEVYDIASVARRRARAAIMEELSNFTYILGRPQIEQLEVEAALNEITAVAIPPQPNGPISLLGPSLLWSFGQARRPRHQSAGPIGRGTADLQGDGTRPGCRCHGELESVG